MESVFTATIASETEWPEKPAASPSASWNVDGKMKSPQKIIRYCRTAVLLGILLTLVNAIWHPFEPRYHGKRLSVWANVLEIDGWDWSEETRQDYFKQHADAVEAIRQIGCKSLPYALKWGRSHDFAVVDKFKDWVNGQTIFQIHIPWAADYQRRAIGIFAALGADGRPAIPALINFFQEQDQNTFNVAANALSLIGPTAIPALIQALTNSNDRVRSGAAMTLGGFESQAGEAVPALIRCLNDSDPQVIIGAAVSLGNIGERAEIAVPALLPLLKDKNLHVRNYAAIALGHIGKDAPQVVPALIDCIEKEPTNMPLSFMMLSSLARFSTNARPAIPLLVKIIESNQWMNRMSALSALRRIDPETAAHYTNKLDSLRPNAPPVNLPQLNQGTK